MASLSRLEAALDNAESYSEWRDIAQALDESQGLDYWRAIERSQLYDFATIRDRLDQMRELRNDGNGPGLLYVLNEGIHGNTAGIGNMALYGRARSGTKFLVEEYIEELVQCLRYVASDQLNNISLADKHEFLQRASHCVGRSALMLSGSGSLFYFHLGVVKALWEQDMLPPIMSGASGGALVSALVGTHTRDELTAIFQPEYIRFEVEKEAGILSRFSLFRSSPLSQKAIRDLFDRLIPDVSFHEAYQRTGLNINISVAPAERHQNSRLLNAVASPNVMIREALLASSAFPGVFPPVTLMARNQKGERQAFLPARKWIDGSVSDDLPIRRVSRLYGVNHFIVSQTNPVALPFVEEEKVQRGWGIVRRAFRNTTREWLLAGTKLVAGPGSFRPGVAQLFRMTSSVLAQTYTGDINILPPNRFHNPLRLLSTRSTEEIMDMIKAGERATWPKIEAIRLQTRVSRELDRLLSELERSLVDRASVSTNASTNASARRPPAAKPMSHMA
ncbi:MAG: DUF3336 domain-containing protein [Spongiibacter sp.]|nr:DUF3336 domain-containing protein [Spongiibacter sp.]